MQFHVNRDGYYWQHVKSIIKGHRVIKMPRCARPLSKTGVYHVMVRGNELKDIFMDDEDEARILDVLYTKRER